MARTPQERRTIEEERIAGAVKSGDPESPAERSPEVTGSGYAYTCMSKEWRDFGFGWNAMVHALRSRDHLSNEERDELLFVMLATPAHRDFFGGEYMALPTMLTAPLFVERHNKTIIAPSWSSYPWMRPVLLQLRDLTVFVLVSLGIVLPDDKVELVRLITETAEHAMHCLSGHSVTEREYMLRLRKRLAALVAACLEAFETAGDGTPQSSRLKLRKARELLTSVEHGLLTEVGTLPVEPDPSPSRSRNPIPNSNPDPAPNQVGTLFDEPGLGGLAAGAGPRRSSTQSVSSTSSGTPGSTPTGAKGKRRSIFGRMSGIGRGLRRGSLTGSMKRGRVLMRRQESLIADITPLFRQEGRALLEKISAKIMRAAEQRSQAQPSAAALEAVHVLSRAFRTPNPGSEPVNEEAKRQLISFATSLRQRALAANPPPPLRQMKTFTSFTPHFAEDVSYSVSALESGDDNTSLLAFFQAVYPDEWRNMCERIGMHPAEISKTQSASVTADLLGRAFAASKHKLDRQHVVALQREANRRASGHFVEDLTARLSAQPQRTRRSRASFLGAAELESSPRSSSRRAEDAPYCRVCYSLQP